MAEWAFTKGADRSNLWKPYEWILNRLKAEFGTIRTQTFDYENGLAVLIVDGRHGIRLKYEYHGENARGHYEESDDEKVWIWEDPDWRQYDILALDDPKAMLEGIINQIKTRE